MRPPPPPSSPRAESGYVLITGLVFLLVLTMIGINAMQGTGLEQKMSANAAFSLQALEQSESGRGVISENLDNHAFYRGWPSTVSGGTLTDNPFTVTTGLTVNNKDATGGPDMLYEEKPSTYATSLVDYSNADATYTANGQTTSIYVQRIGVVLPSGVGTNMVAGYDGLGKSSASGGGLLFFDIRGLSSGGGGGAVALTGADFRHVIRN